MKNLTVTIIVTYFCLTLNTIGIAQNQDDVLTKYLESRKDLKEFQSNMSFSLHINSVKNKPIEHYDGIQANYNNVTYQKIGPTTFVSGNDFSLKFNSEEKAMLIGLSSGNITTGFQEFNVKLLVSFFKKIELTELPIGYKISFTEPKIEELIDFKRIEIIIDKNKMNLLSQTFYYSRAVDLSIYNKKEAGTAVNLGMPILVVNYSNYKDRVSIPKSFFEKNTYFTYTNNKIDLASDYNDYELLLAR